jgi:hypothetical protein
MSARVNAGYLVFCGIARLEDRQMVEKPADLDEIAKAALRFGVLVGVPGWTLRLGGKIPAEAPVSCHI